MAGQPPKCTWEEKETIATSDLATSSHWHQSSPLPLLPFKEICWTATSINKAAPGRVEGAGEGVLRARRNRCHFNISVGVVREWKFVFNLSCWGQGGQLSGLLACAQSGDVKKSNRLSGRQRKQQDHSPVNILTLSSAFKLTKYTLYQQHFQTSSVFTCFISYCVCSP